MTDDIKDELGEMLADGWDICGFSVCMMAMGATSQHILLRKGTSVSIFITVQSSGNELSRSAVQISPPRPAKKGFFG